MNAKITTEAHTDYGLFSFAILFSLYHSLILSISKIRTPSPNPMKYDYKY